MKNLSHEEILAALEGHKTQPNIVFSDSRGKIAVQVGNLTAMGADRHDVVFLATKPGEESREAFSLREALWILGIVPDHEKRYILLEELETGLRIARENMAGQDQTIRNGAVVFRVMGYTDDEAVCVAFRSINHSILTASDFKSTPAREPLQSQGDA